MPASYQNLKNPGIQAEFVIRHGHAYEAAQRKQLHSDLICALAENPAPTVPAVCQRLGISNELDLLPA